MAWTKTQEYKTRSAVRRDDTQIACHKPLDNMPSSPVPFITPSGLVTFQYDLKARIISSPLVKVPLIMRPLIKKRSLPFTLNLKRHSTTIFSRSSSPSSDASCSAGCTPASELADPMSMTEVAVDLPSRASLQCIPSIGAKIVDRFWPEEEEAHAEESCHVPVPDGYFTALAPPPHYRRAPRSPGFVRDVPVCDCPRRTNKEPDTDPLRFPF